MNSQGIAGDVEMDINYITLDPLIFISATLFAFGLSLFFLRIYPYIITLIFKVFRKILPPHLFVLFSHLGRKAGKRDFVMLFIMVMICTSIFNLKIARTINTNLIDNVKFTAGAEVVMKGYWVQDIGHEFKLNEDDKTERLVDPEMEMFDVFSLTELIEPDFAQYEALDTLSNVCKVLNLPGKSIRYQREDFHGVDIMAIEPKEFGQIAFMRSDLTDVHWYHYLNVLAEQPEVVFLSSSIEEMHKYDIQPGDKIELEIYGFKESLVFGGFIDYWPGFTEDGGMFMVANFDYFYSRLARLPYEIWAGLKDGYTFNDLLREIESESVSVSRLDSISEFTRENVFLKAVNASITISFIMSMIVTLLGFVIYWVISIRERELQFGILRSLGLKIRKIYSMILLEQIMVTGVALGIGVVVGQYISGKFLPVITEIVFGDSLVLPIFEYINSSDYLLIVSVFALSVILVLMIILRYISMIKISQAVKIGED
jgi:putative ABC transport system permease protein